MSIKTALIALLSVATVSALSLEGYKCSDHIEFTGDLVAPIRTVRICGVADYGAPNYVNDRTVPGIKKTALPSVASDGYMNSLDSTSPLLSNDNDAQQLSTAIFQPVPTSMRFETLKYPSSKDSTNSIETYRSLQQKLSAIVEEAAQTRRAVDEIATEVQNVFDTLLGQSGNTKIGNTNTEQGLKVNVHLEPSLAVLLTKFLQLPKVAMSAEQSVPTPEPTKLSNARNSLENNTEEPDKIEKTTKSSQESNSDENNSEQQNSTEETTEDYDSWIRLHFGPATTKRVETTEMYSDESFYSNEDSSEESSVIGQQ